MLYDKRMRKYIKAVWAVVAVLVIVSMVVTLMPAVFGFYR